MNIRYLCVLFAILAVPVNGQTIARQSISTLLDFEANSAGPYCPYGWFCSVDGTVFVDNQVFHGGKYSARIERTATSPSTFTTITLSLPIDFAGKTIQWRGWVKTENVSSSGAAALWLREDSFGSSLQFNTTQGLNINGTTDWKQFSISVPEQPAGQSLSFGFLLVGSGKAWVDDLELLVDGVPIAKAPDQPISSFNSDHQFDSGSGVRISTLSEAQIKNLATLAKVWGFLKYHHPSVTSGSHQWDYELLRTIPQVLQASDSTGAATAIANLISKLGSVPQCTDCASPRSANVYMNPDLDWISDTTLLGANLSQTLQAVYKNRPASGTQFFVSIASASNPSFDNEPSYGAVRFPDAGFQLLSLFRFWNMVQYYYPNRDIMADDPATAPGYWDGVLTASVPKIALANTSLAYQQEMIRFIGMIHDTHANLWTSLSARPPIGSCQLPVNVRFVEGLPLVDRYTSKSSTPPAGLQLGDVIEQMDGVAVTDLLKQWRPFYADSNEAARLRDVGLAMTQGQCGPAAVVVRRGGVSLNVSAARVATSSLDLSAVYTHDRSGPAFQLLSKDVAYIKISTAVAASAGSYINAAAGTKGLIIDIRNYPSDFLPFALGQLLTPKQTNFVRFTQGDLVNPGTFYWQPPLALTPQSPQYSGKVVILVDEVTQSSAEYHAMAFRSAPGAVVLGSTTAGADGNVSTVPLPGALSSYISGIGVFYPDNRPTQRVGIIPDVPVSPTILGIQNGKDELVDEAIRIITGTAPDRPVVSLVANAASETPVIGPNTWVEIKGTNLAPAGSKRIWQAKDFVNGNMPVNLDGVSVTVNGKSAYVYYISPTQVNILTPPDAIAGPVQIVVSNSGSISSPFAAKAQAVAPAFFTASGNYILGQHADYSLIGPASLSVPGAPFTPAKPGETVIFYATGFGPPNATLVAGSQVQTGSLSPLPVVKIGANTAAVTAAVMTAPGQYQLNVVVPSNTGDGDQPISATVNGINTQSGLLLTVKQ